MSVADPEIIEEFVIESTEHLASIEEQLLRIEEAGENFDSELVNSVFRAVHSVKGVAGFLGFDKINFLAHRLEDVLDLVRNEQLLPTSSIIDSLLQASDDLRCMISSAEDSNYVDISHHVDRLDRIVASIDVGALPSEQEGDDSAVPAVESEDPDVPTASSAGDGNTQPKFGREAEERMLNGDVRKRSVDPTEKQIRVSIATLDLLMNLVCAL